MSKRQDPPRQPFSRTRLLVTGGLIGGVVVSAGAVGMLALSGSARHWMDEQVSPEPPAVTAVDYSLRASLISERDRALAAGDLQSAAGINGMLAQEALGRARAVHLAWLTQKDEQTDLYPQDVRDVGTDRRAAEWNYRNTAADFFAFHVLAAVRLNPAGLDSIRETLDAELKLRTLDGLCQPVDAMSGEHVQVDQTELIFASSEYVKDGLLSVYEWHGGQIVQPRMSEIVDAIIRASDHPSRFGPIPGEGTEVNGNMLQICTRLSYAMDRPDYAEFASRIADALIQQAMPSNHGLLPRFYNYEDDTTTEPLVYIRDHGNESIFGLSEIYAAAVHQRGAGEWSARADRWAEPICRMFEIIFEHGLTDEGLLCSKMHSNPPRPESGTSDNWGYVLNGATLFVQAAREHGTLPPERLDHLTAQVATIARRMFNRGVEPLAGDMDSDADSVESALYVATHIPELRDEAMAWVDRQMEMMFRHQTSDGLVTRFYLDGNFIRTSLLYANARSLGWRVEPYRDDVSVGAARDATGNMTVVVRARTPYQGQLRPSTAKHRHIMKLPANWPRLNSWPEWSATPMQRVSTGATAAPSPQSVPSADDWRAGIPINLPANGELVLAFQPTALP